MEGGGVEPMVSPLRAGSPLRVSQIMETTQCLRHRPAVPRFSLVYDRISTFAQWPMSLKVRPRPLADAGFFYTGRSDRTTCFCCGVGVWQWLDDDDPWQEHARHSPACEYLLLKKGTDFIKNISLKDRPPPPPPPPPPLPRIAPMEPAPNDNQSAQESRAQCKVCMNAEVQVVCLPCAHLVTCADCVFGLNSCALCRQEIKQTMRVFLS